MRARTMLKLGTYGRSAQTGSSHLRIRTMWTRKPCQPLNTGNGTRMYGQIEPQRRWSGEVCGSGGVVGMVGETAVEKGLKQTERKWNIQVLYDGECPLCMREITMLQGRDVDGRISFVDIADGNYDPDMHAGISFEQAMERIHAILPDGKVVVDVEVFRRLYEEVGLGWVYALTRIPAVEKAANRVYSLWAKYRLPVTGRPDLSVVLQQKKMCRSKVPEQS